jgi:hypothetical protein
MAHQLARTVQKTARNRSGSLTVIVAEHSPKPYALFDSRTAVAIEVGRLQDAVFEPLVRTLPGKCCDLLGSLALGQSLNFVADAYYACATVA